MYPPVKLTRRSVCASLLVPGAFLKGASESLDRLLAESCRQGNLPAMQAATFSSGRTMDIGATGVRRSGSPGLATLENSFHLGSIAKGFTSTLVARLAEGGALNWDVRPVDVIPELKTSIHPGYRTITIYDLLLWRAGVAPFLAPSAPEYRAVPHFSGDSVEQRRYFALHVLCSAPKGGRAAFAFCSPRPPLGSFTKEMQAFSFLCSKQQALPRPMRKWEGFIADFFGASPVASALGIRSGAIRCGFSRFRRSMRHHSFTRARSVEIGELWGYAAPQPEEGDFFGLGIHPDDLPRQKRKANGVAGSMQELCVALQAGGVEGRSAARLHQCAVVKAVRG